MGLPPHKAAALFRKGDSSPAKKPKRRHDPQIGDGGDVPLLRIQWTLQPDGSYLEERVEGVKIALDNLPKK